MSASIIWCSKTSTHHSNFDTSDIQTSILWSSRTHQHPYCWRPFHIHYICILQLNTTANLYACIHNFEVTQNSFHVLCTLYCVAIWDDSGHHPWSIVRSILSRLCYLCVHGYMIIITKKSDWGCVTCDHINVDDIESGFSYLITLVLGNKLQNMT